MKLPKNLVEALGAYLKSVSPKIVKRGRGYFARGDVSDLRCVEEDRRYSALIRGGVDYKVTLDFAGGRWSGECSCVLARGCRHIAAAMLALQDGVRINGHSTHRASPVAPPPPSPVPQPPPSALRDKLAAELGRNLTLNEGNYVRQVQTLFHSTRAHGLTQAELASLHAGPIGTAWQQSFRGEYWQRQPLWPETPLDDFQFWQYVANELSRLKLTWPTFMNSITDLSLVEQEIKEWNRKQEVQRWQKWFRDYQSTGPAPNTGTLELRLSILPEEARLQWRTDSSAEFQELKQVHARTLAEQFDQGSLLIAPNSLPLWSATYKPWSYDSWWSFKYSNSTARPALNRLLRMPLDPDRLVTSDGQPLTRAAEPLRLELRPPQNGNGTYELALTQADGSPPPPVLCAMRGLPTLYLTQRALFHGPPADALESEPRKSIPADALETADGLRFLHAAGVPLPTHMQERVRTVPLTVTVTCQLKPAYAGSTTETVVVTVIAKAPGTPHEKYTGTGWEPASPFEARKVFRDEPGVITIHDRNAQRHFPRVLETLGARWDNRYPGEWRMRLTKKTPEVLVAWLKSVPPEVEVVLEGDLATLRDEPVSGSVELDVTEAGIDWFDLKVALNVNDATLTPEELKLLLNARGGYVRLGKKGWRRLHFNLSSEDDEQLARLGLSPRDFSAEPQRFHALQLADQAAKKFLTPERVEMIQRRANEIQTRVAPALPEAIRAELRPYQTEGYHFLAYLASNRFGGVLADDMGLGKTVQALAWLAWLRAQANSGASTTLVVCPKSVMDNWRAEAERFYPGLRVRLWAGEPHEELAAVRETSDLLVVNYPQLRSLSPEIANLHWLAAILDEAQCIKNPDSQTAQAARALQAEHRLALTGTPIENRLLDLWSIFGFAMPGALGNRTHFLRRFDAKDDPLARRRLAARVRPFLLRRTKNQVAKDLPDRVEEDLLCEMEGKQQTLYRAELKRARQIVLGLKTNQQLNEERFNILTSLLRLRQICCHPALVDDSLRDAESAKVAALEDMLEPLVEEGHKVLVFSQFVTMLDLLRENVKQHGWPHFFLAGETENRGELVEKFQAAEDGGVFLISLKAGGFGLNLTAASYVVLFDPWWNPAVENQAIDRTHRIGQTSKVMAYRLLIRDSIEQKIRALQKQKAALAQDVLGEERFSQSLTLDDLRFLFAE